MIKTSEFGPWALVTGASSGIGLQLANRLAESGINLVLASRSETTLRELARSLSEGHRIETRVVGIDLAAEGAASSLNDQTDDLDIGLVISNAGAGRPGAFLDRSLAELHRAVTLNAVSHVDMAHYFGPRLVARGRGGFVMTAALGAVHGIPNMAIDSAAKGLVRNLGEALHHEFARAGVKVLTILPGAVDTPIIEALGFDRANLPMRPQPVEQAVDEALRALARGSMTLVPGFRMRAITKLVPRSVSIRMNGRMLGIAAARLDAAPTEARPASQPRGRIGAPSI